MEAGQLVGGAARADNALIDSLDEVGAILNSRVLRQVFNGEQPEPGDFATGNSETRGTSLSRSTGRW